MFMSATFSSSTTETQRHREIQEWRILEIRQTRRNEPGAAVMPRCAEGRWPTEDWESFSESEH